MLPYKVTFSGSRDQGLMSLGATMSLAQYLLPTSFSPEEGLGRADTLKDVYMQILHESGSAKWFLSPFRTLLVPVSFSLFVLPSGGSAE